MRREKTTLRDRNRQQQNTGRNEGSTQPRLWGAFCRSRPSTDKFQTNEQIVREPFAIVKTWALGTCPYGTEPLFRKDRVATKEKGLCFRELSTSDFPRKTGCLVNFSLSLSLTCCDARLCASLFFFISKMPSHVSVELTGESVRTHFMDRAQRHRVQRSPT